MAGTGEPGDVLGRRLEELARALAASLARALHRQYERDDAFARAVRAWFADQGVLFAARADGFVRLAGQSACLLVNKLIFANLLAGRGAVSASPLAMPADDVANHELVAALRSHLQALSGSAYHSLFHEDFLGGLVFCADDEVTAELAHLVRLAQEHRLADLGHEVIGRIFERVVPEGERRILGQHFTGADVVDVILHFALRRAEDRILDPACGAGAFLTRAYSLKRVMAPEMSHEQLLATIWGVDIGNFPAQLAALNLARTAEPSALATNDGAPRIIHSDFFHLQPPDSQRVDRETGQETDRESGPKPGPDGTPGERGLVLPHHFDAIVGNPPYTRQEQIAAVAPGFDRYKRALIVRATEYSGERVADISARSGIHSYFFVHGWKLLVDGGRFGFVVLDTWLDADYGVGLQKFLLDRFKICAIIASTVERWFEDANTNTCVVLLERCDSRSERDRNIVRFVNLKVELGAIVGRGTGDLPGRRRRIAEFLQTIASRPAVHEDATFRLYALEQSRLRRADAAHAGTSSEFRRAKWGYYLKAPFSYLALSGSSRMIRLGDIADVRRGYTTGADPWFYVEELVEHPFDLAGIEKARSIPAADIAVIRSGDGSLWPVEKEFLRPVIRNPGEHTRIIIDAGDLTHRVITVSATRRELAGTLILDYIDHGERALYALGKGRRQVPARTRTCRGRKQWYTLPTARPGRLLFQKAIYDCHRHYLCATDIFVNQRFYLVYPHRDEDMEILACILNSCLTAIWLEVQRAALGLGALEATVAEVKELLIPDPTGLSGRHRRYLCTRLHALGARAIGTVFSEYGRPGPGSAPRPDRRDLEAAVLHRIAAVDADASEELLAALPVLTQARLKKATNASR